MLEKWREVMKTEALAELANRVDEKTFQAFDLYGLQNRPMREVATLLNCSSASIYMAKNRCAKIMREIVRKLNTEDGALNLDE